MIMNPILEYAAPSEMGFSSSASIDRSYRLSLRGVGLNKWGDGVS